MEYYHVLLGDRRRTKIYLTMEDSRFLIKFYDSFITKEIGLEIKGRVISSNNYYYLVSEEIIDVGNKEEIKCRFNFELISLNEKTYLELEDNLRDELGVNGLLNNKDFSFSAILLHNCCEDCKQRIKDENIYCLQRLYKVLKNCKLENLHK